MSDHHPDKLYDQHGQAADADDGPEGQLERQSEGRDDEGQGEREQPQGDHAPEDGGDGEGQHQAAMRQSEAKPGSAPKAARPSSHSRSSSE